jgi:hypothetical protein
MAILPIMKARARKRPERTDPGPGGKRTRPQRMNNLPRERDLTTQIEADMAGSGRTGMTPPEATIGPRRGRRIRSRRDGIPGAAVAPTKKAEVRERQRHRLQKAEGVVAASEEGNRKQRRSSKASRAALDAAARKADRKANQLAR